ncbi:MAG: SH3 domain-containing protein [Moorea sp. SIO3C2]|nr:SH3 domain-containing protein [Moorena sp. SIO3C2]
MRILIGLIKFILGVSLAIAIIGVSGLYGARYVMTRLTAPPERPIFPEEGNAPSEGASGNAETVSVESTSEVAPDSAPDSSNEQGSAPVTPEEPLEPGAYQARVIQPIGLILRQGPDVSTTQIGGIAYNEQVVVLSESSDQRWIKIRLADSGVEGWVKNGNTEPLN